MSRRRSRLRAQHSSPNTPKKPHLRLVTAEPAEVREAAHGAKHVATDACFDDRTPPSSALGLTLAGPPSDLPGAVLRRQREAHGLTLDDIARATKIPKNTLRAIEATDTTHLPAAIYTRGFIKAYAAEIGVDPSAAANEYLAGIDRLREADQPPGDQGAPRAAAERTGPAAAVGQDSSRARTDARYLPVDDQARRLGWLLAIAALGAVVIYVWSFNAGDTTANIGSEPAVSDAVPAAGATAATPDATAAVAAGPLQLELISNGLCWVSAVVDGERVLAKLLQPGERHALQVAGEAVLRIGEPGALTLSINGRATRRLGTPGQPTNVRITKDNFHEFLSS